MNILHISDFHYSDNNLVYERVISAIIKSLKENDIFPDCVLFTGDLVFYGNRNDDYKKAKEVFDLN